MRQLNCVAALTEDRARAIDGAHPGRLHAPPDRLDLRGGKVGGGYVRWNFFTDLTVTVGATVWVRNGRLQL